MAADSAMSLPPSCGLCQQHQGKATGPKSFHCKALQGTQMGMRGPVVYQECVLQLILLAPNLLKIGELRKRRGRQAA